MVKTVLKKIRNQKFVNKVVRLTLRNINVLCNKAETHWPPSGLITMNFEGIELKAYSNGDDPIVSSLFYRKPYHESSDLKCFLKFAKSCKIIFDIGANTGIYSILSSKVNSSSVIYAFEPFAINARRLKENISVNELSNVQVVHAAVGNNDETIQFTVPVEDAISDTSSAEVGFSEQTYNGTLKWRTIDVEQIALDSFVHSQNISQVDLLKIDVEGYETKVFDGAKELIKKFNPVILCEIFVDDEKKAYFNAFIKESGYSAYMLLGDGLLRLDEGMPDKQAGLNFLFAPKQSVSLYTPFSDIMQLVQK